MHIHNVETNTETSLPLVRLCKRGSCLRVWTMDSDHVPCYILDMGVI